MARGKNAAALFEVIHAAKQKEQLRAKGGGFLTPSWWFRGKAAKKAGLPTPAPVSQQSSSRLSAPVTLPPPRVVDEPIPAASVIQEEPAQETQEVREMQAVSRSPESPAQSSKLPEEPRPAASAQEERDADNESFQESLAQASAPRTSVPYAAPVDIGVDRFRRRISFQLSYSSAVISTCGLAVLVAIAFIIGKSAGRGPTVAGASSISDVKNGKPNPGALNLPGNKTTANDEAPVTVPPQPKTGSQAPGKPATPKTSEPKASEPKTTESKTGEPKPGEQKLAEPKPADPKTIEGRSGEQARTNSQNGIGANGKRIVGMQYVLINSFADPEDANEAAEALNKAGIAVTVEKNFFYAPAWTCVVTTRGFDRTKSNPEYDAFVKAIRDVSTQYSTGSKFHSKFDPKPLAWR